ncbi:DUF2789 family protein [Neptunicella sp. SCSIO 80796]|uniref:DUF2789 family protein n=1 Tax=Neptunicella plasticusilytica TaxID=3117012 RepID=UPI003A4D1EA6
MDIANPSINNLFEQLGLPGDDRSIEGFIEQHKGLNQALKLQHAPFWDAGQARFLEDALNEDAAWAEVIDQLNARLR